MPLHPHVEGLLNQMVAAGGKPFHAMSPQECRQVFGGLLASLPPSQAKLANVADREVPGPAGPIATRVYTPEGKGPFPVLVFFHGGGWVIGDLASHDSVCRELSGGVGAVVVSVAYRLAPEHKFPAAPDDCLAVTRWVVQNAGQINADAKRVAVGGDSAGGNLAAVVTQQLRDQDKIRLAAQLLIYPVARLDGVASKSLVENAEGYLLQRADMDWFRNHYLRSDADGTDVRVSPILAKDLSGLPPALVQTCEFDPLRDEGEDYGKALKAAGVPTVISRYDGSIHAAFSFFTVMEPGRRMVDEAIRWLKETLRG
ncbi:MAG: esterase/lipase-like protein [Panacagrimonas sp.]|jgi:acetyl esterase|nr:alpha/beta hydrolase [Panacagrimonas sp.]MCC2657478.1 esterase/lipase-like protein [Panacagrimonas sp.]